MNYSRIKLNRFVIRKSLIGKNVLIDFVNKKGENVRYKDIIVISLHTSVTIACYSK
jgi:hypothetical protein